MIKALVRNRMGVAYMHVDDGAEELAKSSPIRRIESAPLANGRNRKRRKERDEVDVEREGRK